MRLRKTVKIDTAEITVKELTVRQIREGWETLGTLFQTASAFNIEQLSPMFEMGVEGIKIDQLYDLAPSEIKIIIDAFKEVNAVFLELGKSLEKENPLLFEMRQALVTTLIGKFVDSSKEGTTGSSNTDGASTSLPAK